MEIGEKGPPMRVGRRSEDNDISERRERWKNASNSFLLLSTINQKLQSMERDIKRTGLHQPKIIMSLCIDWKPRVLRLLAHQIPQWGVVSPRGERWGTTLFPQRKEISSLPVLAPKILSQPRVTGGHYQCLNFYFKGGKIHVPAPEILLSQEFQACCQTGVPSDVASAKVNRDGAKFQDRAQVPLLPLS